MSSDSSYNPAAAETTDGGASHLVVLSARRIRVVDPAGTGTVNVRVVTLGGASTDTAGVRFTY